MSHTCEKCGDPILPSKWDKPNRPRRFCTQRCAARRHFKPLLGHIDMSGGLDSCWPWTARRDRDGYGLYGSGANTVKTHREVYRLAHGDEPPVVRHTCDNPPCCNPLHLIGGTPADNTADMVARGRARGRHSATRVQRVPS